MQAYNQNRRNNPDDNLIVTFHHATRPNPAKSAAEGRPIHDDYEECHIRRPGARDWQPFPATAFCGWAVDPVSGEQRPMTYAERFQHQYMQFKAQAQQTKTGTPLDAVPFLTEGRRAELRAQNVYTVEQLAFIDGQELKNLGINGRDFKNRANEYLAEAKLNAPSTQLAAELEALRARNAILEEDVEALKKSGGEGMFKDMTEEQIKAYITDHSGSAPVGSLNRKTLIRMAMDARPNKVA